MYNINTLLKKLTNIPTRNKQIYLTITICLILLSGIFYWNSIRPVLIKKECARKHATYSFTNHKNYLSTSQYETCLKLNGL